MPSLGFTHRGITYQVAGRHMEMRAGSSRLARLDLRPRTRNQAGAWGEVRIGEFRQQGHRCWAPLQGSVNGKAVLEIRDGYVRYAIETSQKHFDTLVVFPDGELDAESWHTFIWAQRDREWDMAEDVTVRVGDTRPDILDPREGLVADPGDFPCYWPGRGGPRAFAIRNPTSGWWGVSIPGPVPVCDTYFLVEKRRFQILFDYLSPGCSDGFMPEVCFVVPCADPGDAYSIFRDHWALNEPWRLVPDRDYPGTSFMGMALCHPWEAMQHAAGQGWAAPIPPARSGSPMNGDFLLGLLKELVALEPSLKWHFLLPQGWYRTIGDFDIGDNFDAEEGFRVLAGKFRSGGHLLSVHERFHHFNDRSVVGRAHPDWTAPLRPGKPNPYWSPNEEEEGVIQIMDVTREEVREHLKRQIRRFLSGDPGCLDMDGLQLTGDHWPSALDYRLADESYGVGDLLAYRLNRELLLYAKSIKPDALISGTNNPLYGMTQETGTTEDHLPVPIHTIQQLRLITNLYPTLQLTVASYCTTRTKALTAWPLSVAAGRPEISNPRAFTNPSLSADWIPMTEPYVRRMKAALAAYANSPWTPDTINIPASVEAEGIRIQVRAGRMRTQGKLAGFFGALSLGTNTVVTYNDTKAVVVSTVSRTVTVPLPPAATVESVRRLLHSGDAHEHEHELVPGGVRVHVPDSGSDVKLVEVSYTLASE